MFLISPNPKSVTIPITFNIIAGKAEPRQFQRMLASIEPIADQIVIVFDQTSGPVLHGIARQFTDDLIFASWPGDFSVQRNRALSLSRCDYIGWIDSDEWYHPIVGDRLRGLMVAPRGKAFYIWQVSPTEEGKSIYVPQVRVFPNMEGVKWEIPIHEQILPSLRRAGVKTELTDLRVEHLGYVKRKIMIQKNRRNLRILRRAVRQRPDDQFTRSNYQVALDFDRAQRRAAL